MNRFQAEKYLGIASVKVYGKVILRYKIVPTAKGCGYFPAAASYKANDDSYTLAFLLDSRGDEEEIVSLIRHNVKPFIEAKPPDVSSTDDELPF